MEALGGEGLVLWRCWVVAVVVEVEEVATVVVEEEEVATVVVELKAPT